MKRTTYLSLSKTTSERDLVFCHRITLWESTGFFSRSGQIRGHNSRVWQTDGQMDISLMDKTALHRGTSSAVKITAQ